MTEKTAMRRRGPGILPAGQAASVKAYRLAEYAIRICRGELFITVRKKKGMR
jgi:hypothetical protein